MGQGLKNLGNIYSGIFDPAGVVTGKNALERTGLFKMPKGESIEGVGQVGPTKLWKPKDAAGIALSQPKGSKGPKQVMGKVMGTGFLGGK